VHRDLIVDRAGDAVILLHPWRPMWALTNESGLEFALTFDGTRSIADAARAEAARWGMDDAAPILDDLRAFVRQLREADLLANHPLAEADMPRKPRRLPDITIYLTEECNLRCKHCAIVEGRMPQTALSAEQVMQLVEQHLADFPGATVSFTGGEPLLHPRALDIVEHATARTPYVNIATNGLLIDEPTARRLAASGAWIQVSLDGADPEVHDAIRGKGTFTKAWEAIGRLVDAGAASRVLVATTLTRCVLHQVKDLIARVDALGLKELRLLTLNRLKAAETNWEQLAPDGPAMLDVYRYFLLDLPRTDRRGKPRIGGGFPGFVPDADPSAAHWCPLGKTTIVDSQGLTYNCPTLRGPEWTTGSVTDSNLREIREGARNIELRKKALERRYVVEDCVSCTWRNFCQGGCAAFSTLRSGEFLVNDEFCDFRRDLYREHVLGKGRVSSTTIGAPAPHKSLA